MENINKKRLIETFKELASIPSPSGQEERIAQVLTKKLERLGLVVQKDSYGNLVAKLAGEGEPIMLCAHMDTVAVGGSKIVPEVKNDIITSDGNTILGADNKDALTAILEALEVIREKNIPHRAVEVVFTKEEEEISRGIQNFDFSLVSSKTCVVADSSEAYGTIITKAPYLYQFDITIKGTRAHAREPEKGVNAAFIIANAVSSMPLGVVDAAELTKTLVNVSYFQVGLVKDGEFEDPKKAGRNTIPDFGIVQGEVRGLSNEIAKNTILKIQEVFEQAANKLGGKSLFKPRHLIDGYILNENTEFIKIISEILKNQGIYPVRMFSAGGSDANTLNKKGIEAIVIGSAYKNPHKKEEYLVIKDLVLLADFFLKIATRNFREIK